MRYFNQKYWSFLLKRNLLTLPFTKRQPNKKVKITPLIVILTAFKLVISHQKNPVISNQSKLVNLTKTKGFSYMHFATIFIGYFNKSNFATYVNLKSYLPCQVSVGRVLRPLRSGHRHVHDERESALQALTTWYYRREKIMRNNDFCLSTWQNLVPYS